MRPVVARALAPLALVGLSLLSASAHADDEPRLPKPRPMAPDTRTGRPTLALQLGYGSLFGSAESKVSQNTNASWGLVPALQLTYPFSREWAIEAWGSYGTFNNGTHSCKTCDAQSLSAGLGAVYHLIDGIPFDPWFAFGAGFRSTHLTAPSFGGARDYVGLTAIRVAIGGDYYMSDGVGLGPYIDFSAGRYLSRSPGTIDGGDNHTTLSFGLRVVFSPF